MSTYDKFYCTVGCLPMTSFTVICVFLCPGVVFNICAYGEVGRVKNGEKTYNIPDLLKCEAFELNQNSIQCKGAVTPNGCDFVLRLRKKTHFGLV